MTKNKVFSKFNFKKFDEITSVDDVVRVFNEIYTIRWQLIEIYEIKYQMENNTLSPIHRKKILHIFLNECKFDISPYSTAILYYLIENNILQELGYFVNVMKYYFAEEANLMLVEVISRFDIEKDVLEIYKSSLEYLYNKQVAYIYKQVPETLGGFKLRWYSGEIDMTVRRKVNRIREIIVEGKGSLW